MFLFAEENDLGQDYFAPFDVVLSDTDAVQPGLLFVSKDRLHIVTADNVQGAPDLVVEICSPSTARLDWTAKRELYACHGVREYWIVDPEAATVAVLLPDGGELKVAGVCGVGVLLLARNFLVRDNLGDRLPVWVMTKPWTSSWVSNSRQCPLKYDAPTDFITPSIITSSI